MAEKDLGGKAFFVCISNEIFGSDLFTCDLQIVLACIAWIAAPALWRNTGLFACK